MNDDYSYYRVVNDNFLLIIIHNLLLKLLHYTPQGSISDSREVFIVKYVLVNSFIHSLDGKGVFISNSDDYINNGYCSEVNKLDYFYSVN